ncbi:MAG: hypothetical protein AUK48_03255 [Oscillatoriales cyanobacterium CG2_30_44_21]|nr:MAG: hypothetical protein AUK48_03255 [Oscillatoriales cyanobacterium CG2_30_44_21]
MAGYTLILAILILGGMIATLGDRIGTKVGKARLSIFNLRPRDTATVVTIATGGMISASTLGILLLLSGQLRDGLFRLESIRSELSSSQAQKQKIETELNTAKTEQEKAQNRLEEINQSLVQAVRKQSETQALLRSVENKFAQADAELQKASQQEADLRDRIQSLTTEQENLQTESTQLRDEKERIAAELTSISRDRETLKQRVDESEQRLADIEKQRVTLGTEVASLESAREQLLISLEALRKGNVAIFADQLLSIGVVRPNLSPSELRQASVQLLQQAEQTARELLDFLPDQAPTDPVLQITESQVEGLLNRLKDGQSYVIRILSAGNFLKRETRIAIAADVTLNRQIFASGAEIASLQFTPDLPPQALASRIEQLFLLVSFRARREGVLANPLTGKVGNFPPDALTELFKFVSTLSSAYEIKAITKEAIFPASSLSLELVIRQNGIEIARFS